MRRLLLACFCSLAAAGTFTLEQVLSAPFPADLVATRDASKLAWTLNDRGIRNIWVASAPDYKGFRMTSYTEDDGQDINELQWTPDGRAVVFTHGGDPEFLDLPDPNPSAIPAGVEQAIWMVVPGQQAHKLGLGHTAAISPKSDRVAFLRAGQIWMAPLDGHAPAEMLIHARSGVAASELAWSPDGSRLGFVSDRANHSFIAVYDFAAKTLTYLEPSTDRDAHPAWSPDGKQVAFIRTFAGGSGRGAVSTQPWAIYAASVADGTGRKIWRADPGMGSVFHAIVSESQLHWGDGGRILFPWEKDGWCHLYSVSLAGDPARLLTPGNFEVEHVAVSEDGTEAVFSSNQDDIDRRHIWRVPLAGGPPAAVTKGESLEWSPVFAGANIAYLHSDARRPARAAIQMGSTVKDLAPDSIPADFPTDSLVVPQQVIYSSSDGMKVHGQLFLPSSVQAGQKWHALVFIHGGPRRQMLLGWHYMDYYNNCYAMNQFLASQGYVVLAINYRSGIGYGAAFREAAYQGSAGAIEYHDVEGAGLYLRSRADVDPAHIGLWGGSYGGYLTAMGLSRGSDLFAAGVDFHGVHDWSVRTAAGGRPWEKIVVPMPSNPAAQAARDESIRTAYESSPMASVRTWRSPVLLIHGDDDRNVDFSETINLVAALRRQGVYFEQLILPDEIHVFLRHVSYLRAYRATVDFFNRKL